MAPHPASPQLTTLLLGAADGEQKRSAASVAVQLRAASLLQKSVAAANRFPGIVQVVFTAIFGGGPPKLVEAGCRLAAWVAEQAAAT